MKSFKKIQSVEIDNRRKLVRIYGGGRELSLPYSKLGSCPTASNSIQDIYVDKELGGQAITYELKNGVVDSIPLDAFLDFNKDPSYLRSLELYNLTLRAEEQLKKSGLSKREAARRMGTSLSQLSRLLDTTNYQKSIDQMMKLLMVLGATVTVKVA